MNRFEQIKSRIKRSSFTPYIIIIILTFIIAWLLMRPNPGDVKITETHDIVVEKIQAIGKLELAKLSVKDVVNFKTEMIGPDLDYLMVVSGEITGCLDLSGLTKDQVSEKDSVLSIQLPAPEICYSKVNLAKTKLYKLNSIPVLSALVTDEAKVTELMYKKAEVYLQNDSLKNTALMETEKNAQAVLKPILEMMTKKKIELSFNKKAIKP
ncbi:MAG TPA: DUF4230 domain-containing protein [Bacteroidia bacterium]